MELTKKELLSILENYQDDDKIFIKAWSSEVKQNVEVVEKDNCIIIKSID